MLRRSLLTLSLFLVSCACKSAPSPNVPPNGGGGGEVTIETITDDQGNTYQVQQGVKGDPAAIGCADGQREAFVDPAAYPRIAGCLASWEGAMSLRAEATGAACGDDAGACAAPADACAPGWRVCGSTGAVADLQQVSADQCEGAGGGRFSAGLSHCETQEGCVYDNGPEGSYECFAQGWCSEPVCCGGDCGDFGSCTDGIWPGKTHIAIGTDQGCGASTSRRAGGLLCCR